MDSAATVDTGAITGGTDRESNDELRARIKAKLASPPKGGKPDDYEEWAKEAAAVTRSWVIDVNNMGDHGETVATGSVLQYFVMDNSYPDGIPLAGDVTDVSDYIKPLVPAGKVYDTSVVTVSGAQAPVADPVDFVAIFLPSNPTTIASVAAELKSTITEKRSPGGTIQLSDFYDAMGRAGLTSWSIASINGVAPANVTVAAGDIHTLGAIT
jgi:uncharacterized phage protein gp47/JayE